MASSLFIVMLLLYQHVLLQHCTSEIINYNNGTGRDIICQSSEDCVINCNTGQSCADLSIVCPEDNKCIINCNSPNESCVYMIIDARKSSELTIKNCENDNKACDNITIYCAMITISPMTCKAADNSCDDICNERTNSDSTKSQSIWMLLSTLNVLYYIIATLILAICCCCCIILFYIQMSLSYNKTVLKYQLSVQVAKLKNVSNSSLNSPQNKIVQFGKENRASIDIIALKVPQKSISYNSEDMRNTNEEAKEKEIGEHNTAAMLHYKQRDNITNNNEEKMHIVSVYIQPEIDSNTNTVEMANNEPNVNVPMKWSTFSTNNNHKRFTFNKPQYTQPIQHMHRLQPQPQSLHKESLNTVNSANTTVSELTSVTASTVLPAHVNTSNECISNSTEMDTEINCNKYDEYDEKTQNNTSQIPQIPVIFNSNHADSAEQIEYYNQLQKDRNVTQLQFAMNYLNQNGNEHFMDVHDREYTIFSDTNNTNDHIKVNDSNHNIEHSGIVNSVLGNIFGVNDGMFNTDDNENTISNTIIEK